MPFNSEKLLNLSNTHQHQQVPVPSAVTVIKWLYNLLRYIFLLSDTNRFDLPMVLLSAPGTLESQAARHLGDVGIAGHRH